MITLNVLLPGGKLKSFNVGVPICARCIKPVRQVSTKALSDGIAIYVRCHGESDQTVVSSRVLAAATHIDAGYAFRRAA